MELTNGKLAYQDENYVTEEQASQAFGSTTQREFGPKIYGIPPVKQNSEKAEEEEEEREDK